MHFEFFYDGTYSYVSSQGANINGEYKIIGDEVSLSHGGNLIIINNQALTLRIKDQDGEESTSIFERVTQ